MSRSTLVSPPSKEEDDATISSYVKNIVSTADDLSRMRSYNERKMDTILSTSPRIPTPSTSSSSSSTSRLFSSNTATLYYNAMKAKNSTNSNNNNKSSSNSNNKAITWINKSDDDIIIASLEQRKGQDKKEKNKKKREKNNKKKYVSGSSKLQWDNSREVSEKLRLEIKADMDKVGDTLDLKKTKKSSSKEKEKKSSKASDTTTKSTKVSSKKKMDGDTNKEVSEKLRLEIKTDMSKFDDKFDLKKKKKKKKIVSDNAATSSCDTNPNKSNKEVIDNNSDKDLTLSAAHHYASVYKELTSMSQSRLASRLGMPTTTPSSSNMVSVSNSPSSAEPSNNIKDECSVVTQPPASTIKRSNSNSSIATEAPASTPEKKQQSSKQSSSTLDVKKQTTISEWVDKSTTKPTANQTPTLDVKKQTTISEWVEKSRIKPVTFGSTSKTKPVLLKGILKSKKKATSDAAAKPAATFSAAVADLKGTEITVSSQVLTKFDNQWQEMAHRDKQWKVYLKTKEEEGTEIPVSAEFLAEIDDKWRKKEEMELERQYAEIRNSLVSSSLQGHVEEETSKDYCGMSSPLGIFCGEDAIQPSATSKADRHQAEVAQLISLGKIEAHLTKKRAEREAATKDAINKVDARMLESKSSYDHALRNELLNWKSKADDETPAADKSNVERKIESDKDEDNQANNEESDKKLLEVVYEILKEEESNKFKHLNDKTKEAIKAKNRSVIIPKLLRKIKEDGDAAANVPKTIAVVAKEENSDDSTTPTVATVSTAESGQSESSCNMGFVGDFMREMKDWLILLGPERCGGDESRGMATIPFEPEEQKNKNVLSWSDIDGRWNKV